MGFNCTRFYIYDFKATHVVVVLHTDRALDQNMSLPPTPSIIFFFDRASEFKQSGVSE